MEYSKIYRKLTRIHYVSIVIVLIIPQEHTSAEFLSWKSDEFEIFEGLVLVVFTLVHS